MYYISIYLSAMLSLVAATSNDSTNSISNNLRKSSIRYLRGEEDVVCTKKEDCQAQSQEMGYEFFYTGVYPTKGCYSKGTNAFFSLGSEDEMSIPNLSGSKQRIWCNPTSIPVQFEEKSLSERDACISAESCKAKALEVGVDVGLYFYNNEFETRGCYTKTSPTSGIKKAFWSKGTEEEMSTSDLSAPLLERLWCDDKDLSENSLDTDTAYPTPAVVFTNSPVKPTNKPTMRPSKTKAPSTPSTKEPEPTNEPTKNPVADVVDTDGTQTSPTSSNPTKSPATEAPSYYPTVDSFEFNCPAPDFVGCTAVDLSDPQDECTTVGEPCPGSADVPIYCCRDACPRNYCTAKEAQPDASFAKASASTTTNSGETTSAFSFATAVLGLVVMSFNF